MLRIVQNSAPEGAKSYYSTADYYTEGQELTGVWRGEGAARLGLSGAVEKPEWDALCDNKNPETGKTLTSRQKVERRVGYDFNFHVPKSVSILYGLTQDDRILKAFSEAVDSTMQDMELEMQTRVRAGGRNEDRPTGNMVWGEFVHTTARPVDGIPDPHLHAHCMVFNTTWDEQEERWKAGQFAGLKRDAPYFEALFHSRLARELQELGLPVERSRRGWELSGVSKSTLQKFSRRTTQIEAKAIEKGITDPVAKGELGAMTRDCKQKNLSMRQLRDLWLERLTAEEGGTLEALAARIGSSPASENPHAARDVTTRAIQHCFERASVVPERDLIATALKSAAGIASPEAVVRELESRNLLRAVRHGRTCVTTSEVLAEESHMLDFARAGRGTCRPFSTDPHVFKRDWLNEGQRRAVDHVLRSSDRVTVIRGAAGTGKTRMMQEAVEGIEASGKRAFAFAPSADASRGVLRDEGFESADTVARLLLDERLQSQVKGNVIWIDEAGLLSTKTTAQLFDLADRLGSRVILSGDRRQHGSVERGSALRLLEEEAGIVPAEIREIQRQDGDYKQAVKALSEGRTSEGFRQLDRLGWIREVPNADRYAILAEDYTATRAEGKSVLVVSPTHFEADITTAAIRSELREKGLLGEGERSVEVLVNKNLTEAERLDPASYVAGDVLVFHQNSKSYGRGERVAFDPHNAPLNEAPRFQVFHRSRLSIAEGDIIRVTHNGTTADGKHRLNNGALFTVKGFDADGKVSLTNGWTIGKNFGHLAYGYVVTSHSSQGKSIDRVLISESTSSFPAASREQFYVSVSRGKKSAVLYTDDKHALLEAVSRSDERISATELIRERTALLRRAAVSHMPEKTEDPRRSLELVHE